MNERFQPQPWLPLARGLGSRDEAVAWLRIWAAGPLWRRAPDPPDLVHYMVHQGMAGPGANGEVWYWRQDIEAIVSARDGSQL